MCILSPCAPRDTRRGRVLHGMLSSGQAIRECRDRHMIERERNKTADSWTVATASLTSEDKVITPSQIPRGGNVHQKIVLHHSVEDF